MCCDPSITIDIPGDSCVSSHTQFHIHRYLCESEHPKPLHWKDERFNDNFPNLYSFRGFKCPPKAAQPLGVGSYCWIVRVNLVSGFSDVRPNLLGEYDRIGNYWNAKVLWLQQYLGFTNPLVEKCFGRLNKINHLVGEHESESPLFFQQIQDPQILKSEHIRAAFCSFEMFEMFQVVLKISFRIYDTVCLSQKRPVRELETKSKF